MSMAPVKNRWRDHGARHHGLRLGAGQALGRQLGGKWQLLLLCRTERRGGHWADADRRQLHPGQTGRIAMIPPMRQKGELRVDDCV